MSTTLGCTFKYLHLHDTPHPKRNYRYFAVFKPYNINSQGKIAFRTQIFSHDRTINHLFAEHYKHDNTLPEDLQTVGRLDKDSEGLILVTNDPDIQRQLLPQHQHHEREYYVQVYGIPTKEALAQLADGPIITIKKDHVKPKRQEHYKCLPLTVDVLACNRDLHKPHQLEFSVAGKANRSFMLATPSCGRTIMEAPTTWLSLTLQEGKNRQIRKMTAKVGHPTLRLVRVRIEGLVSDRVPVDFRFPFNHVHKEHAKHGDDISSVVLSNNNSSIKENKHAERDADAHKPNPNVATQEDAHVMYLRMQPGDIVELSHDTLCSLLFNNNHRTSNAVTPSGLSNSAPVTSLCSDSSLTSSSTTISPGQTETTTKPVQPIN